MNDPLKGRLTGEPLTLELACPELLALDAYIARLPQPRPSRAEVACRLIARALGITPRGTAGREGGIPVEELNSTNDE